MHSVRHQSGMLHVVGLGVNDTSHQKHAFGQRMVVGKRHVHGRGAGLPFL